MSLNINSEVFITCALTGSGSTQEKSKFVPLEKSVSAVSFNFSKVIEEKDNHKEAIDNLNINLSMRDISEISFVHTEVEILITAKT